MSWRSPAGIYRNRPATGVARVVCYSPRHDVTLAELDVDGVDALLETWQQQMRELAAHPDVTFVLIFENKGEVVGVSNPHPHCQIYATNFTFKYIEIGAARGTAPPRADRPISVSGHPGRRATGRRRLVTRHGSAIAFVPYFARYAYETYVAPLRSVATIADLDAGERRDLATVLRDVVIRFDNLWQMPFPYVMALHQAPVKGDATGFHFHIEFHPPLRRPNLLKYLAGPEIGGGNFLSDTSPEEKAAELVAAGGAALPVATGVTVAHPLLAAIQALHRRIRRDVVEACEQAAVTRAVGCRARRRRGHDLRDRSGCRARPRRGDGADDRDAGCTGPARRRRAAWRSGARARRHRTPAALDDHRRSRSTARVDSCTRSARPGF